MRELTNLTKKLLLLFIITLSMIGFVDEAEAFASSINPNNIKEIRTKEALGITDENILAKEGDGSWYLYFEKGLAVNQFLPYKEYGANAAVFCTMFGSVSPASNNYLVADKGKIAATNCTIDNSWDDATKAGVAAIIDEVTNNNSNKSFRGDDLKDYYYAEVAINMFLFTKDNDFCHLSNTGCTGSGINVDNDTWMISFYTVSDSEGDVNDRARDLHNLAIKNYNNVKKGISVSDIATNNNGFQFKLDAEYGESYILQYVTADVESSGIRISDPEQYSVKIKDSKGNQVYKDYAFVVKGDNDLPKVVICNNNTESVCKGIKNFEEIEAGNYTIEITVTGKQAYSVAQNYSCTGDSTVKYQSITLASTETDYLTANKTKNLILTVEKSEEIKPSLTVKKTDEKGNFLSGATLILKDEQGTEIEEWVSGTTAKIFNNLSFGTYIVKEVKAPDGYVLSDEPHSVTLTEKNPEDSIILVNVAKNEPIAQSADIIVKKVDQKGNFVSGATLRLIDEKGNIKKEWVTGDTEVIIKNQSLGTYTIEEVKAPNGYALSEKKETIKLTENGKTYTVNFVNAELVKVPDTLSNFSKLIIIAGVTALLAGIGLLYFNNRKQEQ